MRKGLGLIAMVALAPMVGGSLKGSSLPNGGTVSIVPKSVGGNYDASMPSFIDAAATALTARGFTLFPDPGHAASVVELLLSRGDVGNGLARVPGHISASATGGGVAIPLGGGTRMVRLQRTRLEMRIRRRGKAGVVWDGVAVTVREAGTRNGTDEAVAADLSRALLQSYPAEPKGVIGVP